MSGSRRAAIAFDIDGVFKYGRQWSSAGLNALRQATEAKIPFVFVTNGGGGLTEATYGQHLKEKVRARASRPAARGGERALQRLSHRIFTDSHDHTSCR